jgi:antitoxin component of MazEF toxin-antitoxin module
MTILTIRRTGNSTGINIPTKILKTLNLKIGDELRLDLIRDTITLTPYKGAKMKNINNIEEWKDFLTDEIESLKNNPLKHTSHIHEAIAAGQSIKISFEDGFSDLKDQKIRTIQNTPYVIVISDLGESALYDRAYRLISENASEEIMVYARVKGQHKTTFDLGFEHQIPSWLDINNSYQVNHTAQYHLWVGEPSQDCPLK